MIYTFSPGRYVPANKKFDVKIIKDDDGGFVEYKVLGSGNLIRIPKGDFHLVFKPKGRNGVW